MPSPSSFRSLGTEMPTCLKGAKKQDYFIGWSLPRLIYHDVGKARVESLGHLTKRKWLILRKPSLPLKGLNRISSPKQESGSRPSRETFLPTFWAFTSIWKNTEKPLAERRIFSFQQLSRSQEVFSRYQRCCLLTFFTIT